MNNDIQQGYVDVNYLEKYGIYYIDYAGMITFEKGLSNMDMIKDELIGLSVNRMTNERKVIAYKLSLWIGIPAGIIGSYLHMTNNSFLAGFLLSLGGISALVNTLLGLIDVLSNKTIKTSEKIMWTSGFFFITLITGLVYFKNFKRHMAY